MTESDHLTRAGQLDGDAIEDDLLLQSRGKKKRRRIRIRSSDDEDDCPAASLPREGLGSDATAGSEEATSAAAAAAREQPSSSARLGEQPPAPGRHGLPALDMYLAAKVQSWRAAVNQDARRERTERPLSPVSELATSSLEERTNFFVALVEKEMMYHGLLRWQVAYNDARTIAGQCDYSTRTL